MLNDKHQRFALPAGSAVQILFPFLSVSVECLMYYLQSYVSTELVGLLALHPPTANKISWGTRGRASGLRRSTSPPLASVSAKNARAGASASSSAWEGENTAWRVDGGGLGLGGPQCCRYAAPAGHHWRYLVLPNGPVLQHGALDELRGR